MARVFVSYSRKNKDFCRQLTNELQKHEIEFWVDMNDIPPTVDWRNEIEKGIEETDAFLAIISPDWIASNVCKEELGIAVKNGKRLIPVVPCEIDWDSVPPDLSHLNFIFFTESVDFSQQLEKLLTALNTDYEWLEYHSSLQGKALEWERNNKENGFLLHSKELDDAEQQISVNATKNPFPTDLQREYVLKSRQGTTRQRRIIMGILIGLIAGMLGIIGLLVQPYIKEAIDRNRAQALSPMITIPADSTKITISDKAQTLDLSSFSIEVQPVSNEVYNLCIQVNKCTSPIGSITSNGKSGPDDPVVWLTVDQAATYCQWIRRRLPTAAEWELAIRQFSQTSSNNQPFTYREVWEWTSSYQEGNSPYIKGDWDGKLKDLIFDWYFIQQGAGLNSSKRVETYKNTSRAFGVNGDLGFRCAQDN